MARGLFIAGTDTEVGKTYVAAIIARSLREAGRRVGVYKPAASGCFVQDRQLVSEDAVKLWEAAGRPGTLQNVCPQRFLKPVAPHVAARDEGKTVDGKLLRDGIEYWRENSDIVVVEGIGGLMSPIADDAYVADLAADFGFPLVVVSRNTLGTINATLQTLITAANYREGLPLAGVVLNNPTAPQNDASLSTNRAELAARCSAPLLGEVAYGAERLDAEVDWYERAL